MRDLEEIRDILGVPPYLLDLRERLASRGVR